ncbi:amidase [Salinisphaera orenii]|uniref:Glutamyl-tRNA amidotransferase subunit A n=1 Tax=Salinisphaera orenii YIM 95161 TaxID=1051139 RepID=A0A423PRE1_9GAMM|nr:amidase family protein [Salinisphaera halophila]ROO28174.1 glutamyl-tRNA amidotransferase subunit A [Salinisphaera halophila YIM 95161]
MDRSPWSPRGRDFSGVGGNVRRLTLAALAALALTACDDDSSVSVDTDDDTASPTFSLTETTIPEIHAALESGSTSCRALVADYLERIEVYDQSTTVNTMITINPAALERAEAIDARIAAGDALGELYCVPVIVKDLYDTADMPTSGGVLALAESVPPDDAHVVAELRDADAIMLGKSNMDEFAFHAGHTLSSVTGQTRNAYDVSRTTAGSSGGTASAVAANFGAVGVGSDTGNSIRGPSSHLALVGLRSTMGLISRDGVIPLNFDRDMTGAMTRTVGDTARMLNVIAGYDSADPITTLSEDNIPDDYTDALQADGLEGARFGVFRRLIDDTADPEVEALFEQAIADLRAAGATIVDPFDVDGYQDALRGAESCRRFRYDLDNYLASLGPDAPVQSLQEIVDSGEFAEAHGEQLRGNLEVTETPAEQGCAGEPGNIRDNPGRQAFRDTMVSAMEAADLDGLIYPTWDNPPQPIITDDPETRDDLPANTGDNSQGLAPASGQPAITVPMGFTGSGLPTGLQIFGYPFAEADLIKYAYAYEQATQHRHPPTLFPAL